MTAIEAKGARCHVSPLLPRIETSRPDRLVIVQLIACSFTPVFKVFLVRIGNSFKVENAARRYDHLLLDSGYLDNQERFFFGPVVRQVDHFALEDFTPVQIHQYFRWVRDVDVKNSEAHPSILQLLIARFGSSRHRLTI